MKNSNYIAVVLVVRDTSNSIRDRDELVSVPMIFERSQIEDAQFNFEDHIESHQELVFVQNYNMLKQQLLAVRRLAKSHNIELD